jgi:hypothetical protein
MSTINQPKHPRRKTVEFTITRDETVAVGQLIKKISGEDDSDEDSLEPDEYNTLSEQLLEVVTQPIVKVLPLVERALLAAWASAEGHHEIRNWVRAAKGERLEYTWTEEVDDEEDINMDDAEQMDLVKTLIESNKELMRKLDGLEKTVKEDIQDRKAFEKSVTEFMEMVKKDIKDRKVFEKSVKEFMVNNAGLDKSVKGMVAVATGMKRRFDEAFDKEG